MANLFAQYFLLRDHPFAPDDGLFVSPDKALNVFEGGASASDYFAKLQAFADAITQTEAFLGDQFRSLKSGKPPSLMILGRSGSGRNTMAAFAAHLLRVECQRQGLPDPSYSDVTDTSDDPGRFLEDIRQVVLVHHAKHGVDCKAVVDAAGTLDPDAPSRAQLERLFKNLAKITPPTLALNAIAIGPIPARREGWMLDFRQLLAPLRVVPIFYTSDSTVAATFNATPEQSPRQAIQILELDPADASSLLRGRFSLLKAPDRDTRVSDALFPYSDSLIKTLFPQRSAGDIPRVNIKYVLTVCSAAFDAKVNQLQRFSRQTPPAAPAPDPMLTFAEIEAAIRQIPRWRP
jgi:hypothetical protein